MTSTGEPWPRQYARAPLGTPGRATVAISLAVLTFIVSLTFAQLRPHERRAPRPMSSDLCATVPAALLEQMVPAGNYSRKTEVHEDSSSFTWEIFANCSWTTDPRRAKDDAAGTLEVKLDRYGVIERRSPD